MNRLGWGLIGCGDIAQKRVAPALRNLDNCDLIGVARKNDSLAEFFAKQFGAKKWYNKWQDLLADDEIDAVYVATPVNLHMEITIAAAEAGKHVLCEKPMALNAKQCDKMIRACTANHVKLGVAYYRHFYPVINRIKEIIAQKKIGTVVLSQINAFEKFQIKAGEPRYWLLLKEQAGGGPMMDVGCHRIEVFLNLFGPIRKTTGFNHNVIYDREVEDTAAAFFEFESGATAILNVTHAAFESQDTLDIFGTDGSIHVRILNHGDITVRTAAGEEKEALPPHPNLHQPLIESFSDSVLNNTPVIVDGNTGKNVTIIEDFIYNNTGVRLTDIAT
ncbi:Gfo/Idh/MocA family oxidoreductase [candidate division KSB1 bacterium]|nr:Gfo/Idh/MocA family oxidoreductase [candidate division KSB1 bacterium]